MIGHRRTLALAKKPHGFTLIELLVVIAIIGLLSSVVLASLNVARKKAQTSAGLETLTQMATEATLYYNQHGNYGAKRAASFTSAPCSYFTNSPTSGYANTFFSQDPTMLEELRSLETQPGAYAQCFISGDGKTFSIQYVPHYHPPENDWMCLDPANGIQRFKTYPTIHGTC